MNRNTRNGKTPGQGYSQPGRGQEGATRGNAGRGGSTRGGTTRSGDTRGRDTRGGDTRGGDTRGGDTRGRGPGSGRGEQGPRQEQRAPRPGGWQDRKPRGQEEGGQTPRPERERKAPLKDYRPPRPAERPRQEAVQSIKSSAGPAEAKAEESAFVPGLKPVLELLESDPTRVDCVFIRKGRHGAEADRVIDLCRQNKVRFSLLEVPSFEKIYTGRCQGVVARVFGAGFVEYETLLDSAMDAPLPLIVLLDQVQDPGNAGTLARTLYALGGAGLVVPRHNGVFLGGAAAKAAAGALQKLPVAKVGNVSQAVDAAKKLGFVVYGTGCAPEGSSQGKEGAIAESTEYTPLYGCTPRLPALLILGGEDSGVRTHVGKRADTLLHIPMLRAFDSLNVAQAGAIIISWFAHQYPKR
ncbi:TrmH family RNA methyltransferase [Desulfovibrio cuneatus]|uniref:TrmH family RNA methyltransferase n=1 Tax=Desulfovibrio cuneatus TaxID=159728 RepID=UPI000A0682C1|nr:RNA methyltransferase [Desulfovibrio cuneatus]